jgi:hypothetical protein
MSALSRRVRTIERRTGSALCPACRNIVGLDVAVLIAGEPDPPPRRCGACGRESTMRILIRPMAAKPVAMEAA